MPACVQISVSIFFFAPENSTFFSQIFTIFSAAVLLSLFGSVFFSIYI